MRKQSLNRRAAKRLRTIRQAGAAGTRPDFSDLLSGDRRAAPDVVTRVRALALQTLTIFHRLTERHGCRYFLAYGTLLGAMRHGGFIPWDDDIDVQMPRSDFERFLRHAGELPDSLILFRVDLNFWKLMDRYSIITKDGKRGVAVDIFLTEESDEALPFINVHRYAFTELPQEAVFPLSTTSFAGTDLRLPIPADPDRVLGAIYRDWRALPPEEQRVNPHLGEHIVIRNLDEAPLHPSPFGESLPVT